MIDSLDTLARQLVDQLRARKHRIVFAESCTGGLVAATIAKIPGVSDCLCGSAVTYSNETKIDWLGVSKTTIETYTAVSEQAAKEMALGVLERTRLATVATAITGHLGPDAPADLDGVIFLALAERGVATPKIRTLRITVATKDRFSRQKEAVDRLLMFTLRELFLEK
jgi:nicotinamide-nucleotide amidase